LGYIKATDANDTKTIVPDSQRAALITKAFEMYATGLYTKQQILDAITTPRADHQKRKAPQRSNALPDIAQAYLRWLNRSSGLGLVALPGIEPGFED